jgi:hypothetical protein
MSRKMDTRGGADAVRDTEGRVLDWMAAGHDVTVFGYGAP